MAWVEKRAWVWRVLSVVMFSGFLVGPVLADVGELMAVGGGGTIRIVISQGATTLLDENFTFPTDVNDIKQATLKKFELADALNTWANPVYLEILSNGGAVEPVRTVNMFFSASGGESLFNTNSTEPVSVSISNISVKDTVDAQPLLLDKDEYSVVYMINYWGYFYEFPEARPWDTYGNKEFDVQVPGPQFLDGTNPYSFLATGGTNIGDPLSWMWQGIRAPGTGTTVASGIQPGLPGNGEVYQMGLGVSIVGTHFPEPASLLLLAMTSLVFLKRRKLFR